MFRHLISLLLPTVLAAQTPADVVRERADYLAWLKSAPNSPLAAVARQPIGGRISMGPGDADIPLPGLAQHRIEERNGAVTLQTPQGSRPVPRGVPVGIGRYTLSVDGPPGRTIVTVYGTSHRAALPEHYPYDPSLVFVGPLLAPARRGTARVLAVDGTESEAGEAGSVLVPLGHRPTRLLVRRFGERGNEESELEIYFRDDSNGAGTYPAGRFVPLLPLDDGRYRLDFNRARNPFCAYSSVYPCPAPWRGNTIDAPVAAGERYAGGGLAEPGSGTER